MNGVVTVPIDWIVGVFSFVVQMACVFGALFVWGGRIDQRLKNVEADADAVRKIEPMEARFQQFERGVETRLEGIERAVREAAAAVQQLAISQASSRRQA